MAVVVLWFRGLCLLRALYVLGSGEVAHVNPGVCNQSYCPLLFACIT
jgi:hypothetical protein